MVSFYTLDYIVIALFFLVLVFIASYFFKRKSSTEEEYFLNKRSLGLGLFIATNVSTWYGGILGMGEFTYKYGILSWVTQGLPYYFFALLFAFLLAGKIRKTSFYTIPELMEKHYGRYPALLSSILIFILTSPAPYLMMVGQLIAIFFGISYIWGVFIGFFISLVYLFWGGYKSDVWSDLFMFFIMYIGFAVIAIFCFIKIGNFQYLEANLPSKHLSFTGGTNYFYLLTWFLIALWTFADPGFHQRCYAARTPKIAFWGIILSIPLWFIFDYLTVTTGLFARASMPTLDSAILSYPTLANKILPIGFKGLFFIALLATILSTLNSFIFISSQTFGKDILKYLYPTTQNKSIFYSRIGMFVSAALAITLSFAVDSIIEIWYLIGSICIPGIIFPVIGAYFPKFKINNKLVFLEIIFGSLLSLTTVILNKFSNSFAKLSLEPMLCGLTVAIFIHLYGLLNKKKINYS